MTAMSAPSASETPSPANPFLRDLVASLRTVVVPGSPATYANRAALRGMGLRWDPAGHRWHGTATADRVRELRERLGLEVRVFGTLEPPRGPSPPRPPAPTAATVHAVTSVRDPTPRPHDGSRSHAEARTVYRADEDGAARSRFSERDITSGLPDDSREEDERQEERRLRDLRGRVKAARAAISATPGAEAGLRRDRTRATQFYAKFGVSEATFLHGATRDVTRPDDFPPMRSEPHDEPLSDVGAG
jgi:hypothetical protein